MNTKGDFAVFRPQEAPRELDEVRQLLAANDLELDSQIEVFVVCRVQGRIIACAGLDHYTIKCVAVAEAFRGEALSLRLGGEVVNVAAQRGWFHLFLYSPPHNLQYFRGWGFYPLVEVPQLVVLLENSPVAIHRYCHTLSDGRRPGRRIGAIVLNANPFTRGHRYLIERAAAACDWVHVFVVSEDASLFSYTDRLALVTTGVKDLGNVIVHPGSEYVISRATFPGYFLKDKSIVEWSWAAVDLLLFREYIAPALGITHRYVGTEPLDPVTRNYNADMKRWLSRARSAAPPITVIEVPRLSIHGTAVSASRVRRLWTHRELAVIRELVPATTWDFLQRREPTVVRIPFMRGRDR
jgi:[citrate (pro-3S)-lyase] ligase